MTNAEKDFDLLSAYVDGELDPADSARLAQRIAQDERLARQIAKLAELKSALASPVQDVIVVNVTPRRSPRWPLWSAGLAACLALALIGMLWQSAIPSGGDGEIAQAFSQHDAWTRAQTAMPVAPISVPADAFAPQLTASGLSIAFVRGDAVIAGEQAVQIGYAGRNGCQLSLFRFAARPDIIAAFSLTSDDKLQRAMWRDAANAYLLVARGMDQSRFAAIAGVLRDLSSDAPKPAAETTASLQSPHQPCIG